MRCLVLVVASALSMAGAPAPEQAPPAGSRAPAADAPAAPAPADEESKRREEVAQALRHFLGADAVARKAAGERLRGLGAQALPAVEDEAARIAKEETEGGKGKAPAKPEESRDARARLAALAAEIRKALDARAQALVKGLGDDDFGKREQAQRDLLEMGPPALEAVKAGLDSLDPEIRSRAADIAQTIEMGPWKKALFAFLGEGSRDDAREIEPERTKRFCPDLRFFAVGSGLNSHYRVSKSGGVEVIGGSPGGDVNSMFGDVRPRLASRGEVLDFLRLAISLRYGFEDLDMRRLTLEDEGPGSYAVQASSRRFTVELDGEKRLVRLTMK